jgi:drug/metabolite transporter (DMT)-like permease
MDNSTGIRTTMGLREWVMLSLLSIIWGGTYMFVGIAVYSLPPLTIVALRVTIAALAFWSYVLLARVPMPKSPVVWRDMLIQGVINNAFPFSLLVWGQTAIASGLAAILNATTPLFTVLIAGALLPDERITPLKSLGVLIGFGGAVLVIGPEQLVVLGLDVLPQLACVLAGLFYAVAVVFGRRFKEQGVSPVVVSTGMLTSAAAVMVPAALIIERPWTWGPPEPAVWFSILGLALICTVMAYFLYFSLLDSSGATNTTLVTFLIPVSAILLGALVLDERLRLTDFAGMAVIGLGLLLVDGRILRWRFRQRPS